MAGDAPQPLYDGIALAESRWGALVALEGRIRTWQLVHEYARDSKAFDIEGDDEDDPWPGPSLGTNCWGCGCRLHNMCRLQLAQEGLLQMFHNLHEGLCGQVTALKKEEASSAEVLLQLQEEAGSRRVTWALLVLPSYSPKIQLYAQCGPAGQPAGTGGSRIRERSMISIG